jgi:hypothetical protein
MGKSIQIDVSDDEYERLETVKEAHGLTWRGMLLAAKRSLDDE